MGESPLHLAASKDHEDIVKILLESGSNPKLQNKQGQFPIDLCHDAAVKTRLRNWNYVPGEGDDEQDEEYLEESDDEGEEEEQDESISENSAL